MVAGWSKPPKVKIESRNVDIGDDVGKGSSPNRMGEWFADRRRSAPLRPDQPPLQLDPLRLLPSGILKEGTQDLTSSLSKDVLAFC